MENPIASKSLRAFQIGHALPKTDPCFQRSHTLGHRVYLRPLSPASSVKMGMRLMRLTCRVLGMKYAAWPIGSNALALRIK